MKSITTNVYVYFCASSTYLACLEVEFCSSGVHDLICASFYFNSAIGAKLQLSCLLYFNTKLT